MKYPKKYTQKEWNKFSWDMQEKICERYNVFLTDHKTRKEKTIHFAKKFNKANLDKGLTLIHKTTKDISKFANSLDFGAQRDKSFLSSPKRKVRF